MSTLLIFVKYPEPGKVKTRLGLKIGIDVSAQLYELFIAKTFELAQRSYYNRKILYYSPAEKLEAFQRMAPPDYEYLAQPEGDLGSRLKHGFAQAFDSGSSLVVALGTDSPTLPVDFLNDAIPSLTKKDVAIGPAKDGGYYLIGLNAAHLQLFENVEWSSDKVLSETLATVVTLNLTHALLPEWYDVDDLATLRMAAEHDSSGDIQRILRYGNIE